MFCPDSKSFVIVASSHFDFYIICLIGKKVASRREELQELAEHLNVGSLINLKILVFFLFLFFSQTESPYNLYN